tara:strand:+ start:85 stop:642 length:558 start_codon:yes stop_codon:yes gene_type:complete
MTLKYENKKQKEAIEDLEDMLNYQRDHFNKIIKEAKTSPLILINYKLAQAQKELSKGVKKNAKNPHFGSDYADLSAVLETALNILPKYDIAITQGSKFIDGVFFVTTKLLHVSGEFIESELMMPIKDRQGNVTPHSIGQAMTYGRRYLLTAVLGLGQVDDDGNELSLDKPKVIKHKPKTINMEDF